MASGGAGLCRRRQVVGKVVATCVVSVSSGRRGDALYAFHVELPNERAYFCLVCVFCLSLSSVADIIEQMFFLMGWFV